MVPQKGCANSKAGFERVRVGYVPKCAIAGVTVRMERVSHSLRPVRDSCVDDMQAMNLRIKLERLSKLENAVWVTSPLTRAVETFLLSCPKRQLLVSGNSQTAACAGIKVLLA